MDKDNVVLKIKQYCVWLFCFQDMFLAFIYGPGRIKKGFEGEYPPEPGADL
ncbi:hypothetical protein DCCM_2160 [Desulfocucumis palustris]|uniref:Uncharacterized protein n=1 Tax=Desulfocucumis palustris TaxID=1898651 RepID=A0A2L2XBK1_9FIRM|nr:hypothetical protein DCCM_2160 [Desulfocucumis palustris]